MKCESCDKKEATTKSKNPDYSGYELCAECAREYDSRIGETTKRADAIPANQIGEKK